MSEENKSNDVLTIADIDQIIKVINTIIDKVATQPDGSNLKKFGQFNEKAIDENHTASQIDAAIVQASQTLTAINSIKIELSKLSLNPGEKAFIENSITPLLGILNVLSNTSYNLSGSVNILTTSPIVPRKKGELKDTIHTVYSINKECNELYDILKKRLRKLNKEAEHNSCTY